MAGLLADGLNLGLTRMADACTIASLGQLAWVADWHIRDETYALALRRLVDHQQREPLAAIFGGEFASSSDGQSFRAGGFGRDVGRLNAHYGDEPGSKFYTHLSDRFAPFFTKVIAATASEALHILDGLLYHQSDVTVRRHHTDGGGDSEHVFALLALLGFQFAPRIPDLKHRRLYSFAKPSAYPTLEPLIAGGINVGLIRAHWPEILRVAASIRTGTVTASLIMRQLAAYPRQNGVAAALRELGRLERTLFTLDWIEDPELRRDTGRVLVAVKKRVDLAILSGVAIGGDRSAGCGAASEGGEGLFAVGRGGVAGGVTRSGPRFCRGDRRAIRRRQALARATNRSGWRGRFDGSQGFSWRGVGSGDFAARRCRARVSARSLASLRR